MADLAQIDLEARVSNTDPTLSLVKSSERIAILTNQHDKTYL